MSKLRIAPVSETTAFQNRGMLNLIEGVMCLLCGWLNFFLIYYFNKVQDGITMFEWLDKLEEAIPGKAATSNVQEIVLKSAEKLLEERQATEDNETTIRKDVIDEAYDEFKMIKTPWIEYLITAMQSDTEPHYRNSLQRLWEVNSHYVSTCSNIATEEDDTYITILREEDMSPARINYKIELLMKSESNDRRQITETMENTFSEEVSLLTESLEFEQNRMIADANNRSDLFDAETHQRESLTMSESACRESLGNQEMCFRGNVKFDKILNSFIDDSISSISEEVFLLQELQFFENFEFEGNRQLLNVLQRDTFNQIVREELTYRKSIQKRKREEEEKYENLLISHIEEEERKRVRLYAEEESESQEMKSLLSILNTTHESTLDTAKREQEKELIRMCKSTEHDESDLRNKILNNQDTTRDDIESTEYQHRNDVYLRDRRSLVERSKQTRKLLDSESHSRRGIRESEQENAISIFNEERDIIEGYYSWLSSERNKWPILTEAETTSRHSILVEEKSFSEIIECCKSEFNSRLKLIISYATSNTLQAAVAQQETVC